MSLAVWGSTSRKLMTVPSQASTAQIGVIPPEVGVNYNPPAVLGEEQLTQASTLSLNLDEARAMLKEGTARQFRTALTALPQGPAK